MRDHKPPTNSAIQGLKEMPDAATMNFLIGFELFLDGKEEEALESLELAVEMFEIEEVA